MKKNKKLIAIVLAATIMIPYSLMTPKVIASDLEQTMIVNIKDKQQPDISGSFTVPNLREIVSVSIDNGQIDYSLNGNIVNYNLFEGEISGNKLVRDTFIGTSSLVRTDTNFPNTVLYDDGVYSGNIPKSGGVSSVQTGWDYIPESTRVETATRTTTGVTPPDSINYSKGGYSGELMSEGAPIETVVSGSYTPADSFTAEVNVKEYSSAVTFLDTHIYNSGGYRGVLTKSGPVVTGSEVFREEQFKYLMNYKPGVLQVRHNWSWYGTPPWIYSGSFTNTAPLLYYLDDEGYCGWLNSMIDHGYVYDVSRYKPANPYNSPPYFTTTTTYSTTTYYYYGKVILPELSLSTYTQKYVGTVIKPAVDTRVIEYTQNYSGTVTKPAYDLRTYEYTQNYEGEAYSEWYPTDYYDYEITVVYKSAPTITVDKVEDTNLDVIATIEYSEFSPIKQYKLNNEGWRSYTGPITITGNCILYARSSDGNSSYSDISQKTISNIDKITPTGSIIINNGSHYTDTREAILTLFAQDLSNAENKSTGVKEMRFANLEEEYSDWEPYNTTKNWTLKDSSSLYNSVSVQFRDNVGNIGEASATIAFAEAPLITPSETEFTNKNVTLTINYDAAFPVKQYKIDNGSWINYSTPFAVNKNSIIYAVSKGVRNGVNVETATALYKVENIDKIPPTGNIAINDGASMAEERVVTLNLYATDNLSGVDKMRFKNETGEWSDWIDFSTSYQWELSEEDGDKVVSVEYRDRAGNISIIYKNGIYLEDHVELIMLRIKDIVSPPKGTVAPINLPTDFPINIKAGYKITFEILTKGADEFVITLFSDGVRIPVYTYSGEQTEIKESVQRKNDAKTFAFWIDKNMELSSILDLKIRMTKENMSGTKKIVIDDITGGQFAKIIGSSKEDSEINLTY